MSITSLSFDVSAPLTPTRPVERKDGGGKNLSAAMSASGQREGKAAGKVEEKKEESVKSEESKPGSNLLESALEFSQDQETGVLVVKMYNRTSGELIRQLPPEETLALLRRLAEENKRGVLVSKKL
jgi:flagellar protein FlaG